MTQLTSQSGDGNGAGFFGYPSHPGPNGTGFKFNKRVRDFFLNPRRVRVLPHPAPFTYKINFKIKINLKFKINLILNLILLFLIYR